MNSSINRFLQWGVGAFCSLLAVVLFLLPNEAGAYTYNSYTIEPTVTNTTTALGGTDTVTITFTMPAAMSTSGYFSISTPYLYSYASGSYQSEYVDLTNATLTSDYFSQSYKSTTYISLTPTVALTANQTVSLTLTGVTNPATLEGTGTYYVSGYEYTSDNYNSMYGSTSVTYGQVDLTLTVTTTTATPLSAVSVYLSYYGSSSAYEYYSGTTNSLGQVSFAGLTSNRSYNVSFYYSGSATTEKAPAATTLTYTGGSPQTQTYTFVAPNVTTTYKDANGTAVQNAYWYLYNSAYTVWQYGYTTSAGVITAAATTDGTYTLKVAESSSSYNYYTYTFTVSGGVSNLASVISIPSPEVSGTVTAGGTGVSGVSLTIRNANWSIYQTDTTDSTGAFSFALGQSGTYQITVSSYGLPTGYFPSEAIEVSVTGGVPNSALTIALSDAVKTISGTVKDASGNAITDAYVYGYQTNTYAYASTTTNSSGEFTMSATKGAWTVYVYPSSWPSTWASPSSQTITFSNDETDETETATFTVDKYNAHIIGTVKYPDGTTVGANDVYCYAYGGKNNSTYSYGYTNSSGAIDMLVTEGTYNVYCYFYGSSGTTNYVVPTIASQSVAAEETVDMGIVELEAKESYIEGTVKLSTGEAQSGINIYAYKDGSWDYAYATTDENGKFQLLVSSGKWNLYLYTWNLTNDAGQTLLYTGGSKSVTVAKKETVTGQDFNLTIADAEITFQAVDASDANLTSEYGWASIVDESGTAEGWSNNGCYVNAGSCNLKVASGTAYKVQYYSYSNWYTSFDEDATTYTFSEIQVDDVQSDTVTLTTGENQTVELVMAANDATISGTFRDEDGNPISIYGNVYAQNDNNGWASVYINNSSTYSLKLSAGSWRLSYWTYGGFTTKGETSIDVEAVSGETVTDADFYPLATNSTISGTVLDGEGEAVDTPTLVEISTEYGTTETSTGEEYGTIEKTTYTDENGDFEIDVPEGTYFIRAATDSTEFLDPQPVQITADEAGSAEGVSLKLVEPDATITGTVIDAIGIAVNNRRSLAVGDGVEGVYISGYSQLGNTVTTETDDTGTFTIPALQGDTWFITAFYQVDQTAYYSETDELEITGETVSTTIPLANTLELPEPQAVQFDPQEPAVVTVADSDGTVVLKVNIPANAITTQDLDNVTVRVEPTLQLAHEAGKTPLSLGFELTATNNDTGDPITQFAGDVTIETTYDETTLTAAGVSEGDLKLGYFEDSAATWRKADGGVVVDTDANTMTVSIDHFSTYAVLSPKSSVATADEDNSSGGGKGGDKAKDGILSTPTKLKAKSRTAKRIALDWKGDQDASSYRVQLLNAKTKRVIKTIKSKKSKATIKKLKTNAPYVLQVRAIGLTGSKTPFSDQLSTRTVPSIPLALSVSAVSHISSDAATATVQWTKPRGVIKSYVVQVFEGKTKLKQVTSKKATVTVDGLEPGHDYSFRVKARFNKKNASLFSKKKAFSTN